MTSSGGPAVAGREQSTDRDPAVPPLDPEAVDPEAVDPEAVDPEAVDPETVDPEVVDPGVVEPGVVDPELAGRLRMAVGLLVRRLRQRDPGDLPFAQLSALLAIEAVGPVRSGDLATREHVAAPTMTRLIGLLADAGYVTRSPDPSDGRGSLVSLSPAGLAALEAVRRQRTSELTTRLARLTETQRASLAAALPALEALLD
jgi:DNA-binding MarR family transcriptional regulator